MQGFVNVYFKYHAYYLFVDLSYSRRREEKNIYILKSWKLSEVKNVNKELWKYKIH